MAQILDLSKRFTQEQIDNSYQGSSTFEDLPAGGYICKIVDVILNDDQTSGKANIELHIDIAEGEHAGYFQNLEDRYGWWGLKGWMSFKEEQLANFQRTCAALCNSNPGLIFNPFAEGGVDVDILKDKQIGVVTRKEEYKSSSGEIREKNSVARFIETDKIRDKKFKVPEVKKLKEEEKFVTADTETIPF